MFSFEYDTSTVGFEKELSVTAVAHDLDALLVAWLSELLYLHDAEGFVPGDFIVVEIGEPPMRRAGAPPLKVAGTVRGRRIGDWFEQSGPQIKGTTLHGIAVAKKRRDWEATVYLDV